VIFFVRVNGQISGVTFFGLSLVETERLERIEQKINSIRRDLKQLLQNQDFSKENTAIKSTIDAAQAELKKFPPQTKPST